MTTDIELGDPRKKGVVGNPTYVAWRNMKARCTDPKAKSFKWYGGRGIKVCDRWSEYDNFLEDMGPKPSGASLDRIDSNGNYEPGNCRWLPLGQQQTNRRNNHRITVGGVTKTCSEWAREAGISQSTINQRIKCGVPEEVAVTLPRQPAFKRMPREAYLVCPRRLEKET